MWKLAIPAALLCVALLWITSVNCYTVIDLESLAATPEAAAADRSRLDALRRELAAQAPRRTFAVIDTYGNRLVLRSGDEVLREAVCSTGSGMVLRHQESGREWVFDTPIGERRIVKKTRDPKWIKPDWAFVEEGYEPPEDARHRIDDLSLGDYGIYLGDGYLIHGTLFRTLLGRKITHGCIRLGDDDLAFLYRTLGVGDRVLLY